MKRSLKTTVMFVIMASLLAGLMIGCDIEIEDNDFGGGHGGGYYVQPIRVYDCGYWGGCW